MQKIGEVKFSTSDKSYYMVWYNDDRYNERIDLINKEDIESYNIMNTENCEASYIKRNTDERQYGSENLIAAIMRIKAEAAMLHVPEQKNVYVDDGKFVIDITKQDEDVGKFYRNKMINGRISEEIYRTDLGDIEIFDVKDIAYLSQDRPTNWDDYEVINTVVPLHKRNTTRRGQAEYYTYDELLRKYPQVTHVLNNDYKVVQSYEEAMERLDIWINSKEQLKSYDIESLSTDWGPFSDNRITGVFLGLGETWSTYFPFRQDNFEYNLPLEFLKLIFDAINNQPKFPEVILLAYNVKFEIQGFYQEYRKYIRCDIDLYLLAVLIDPLIKKGSHTLKAQTAKVDHNFYLSLEHIFIGPVQFNVLPPEIVLLYGCPDATSPAKLYKAFMKKLPKDEYFVMSLEMGLPVVKAMNEFYGLRLNQDRLLELIADEEYKVELLSNIFKKHHKTSKNINSNDVLADIIYNKLRCKVDIRTSKGAPSTSKAAIDNIIKKGAKKLTPEDKIPEDILDRHGDTLIEGKDLASNMYPTLVIYQKYKKCCKELGALRRLRDKSVNGYFKFYINQVGAGSNRQTSDAHQFSDTMKSCAIADSKYHGLVSCDWKQIELRVLAGLAGQKDLMELEKDASVDIHRAVLSIIKDKPMYLISEEERKAGKSVNFGVVYMMTEYGLAIRDYGPNYTEKDLEEERKKITDFFNGLPNIKEYLKKNEEFLVKNGYIKTALGYYRYLRELLDPTIDKKLKKRLIRSGNNTPVQGFAAQLLKMDETRVWEYIRAKGWDKEKDYDGVMLPMVRMIVPIHDEILLSYDKEIPVEEIILMFKECMEIDMKDMPPFFAAPAFIDNWYQGKDPAYEIDIPLRDKIVEEYKKGNYMLTGKNYLEVLNEYRDSEIRDYMADLISKYKTKEEVAKHVTHDALTHTLIETMIPKAERKKLTHEERIFEATRRYMDSLNSKGKLDVLIAKETKDDATEYMDLDEWSNTFIHIDANGDLIVEQTDDDEEDDDYDPFNSMSDDDKVVHSSHVMYLMNECLVDMTGLDIHTTGEEIHQKISTLSNKEGFYDVVYVMGDKTIKTPFKVDYIEKEIESLFDGVTINGGL